MFEEIFYVWLSVPRYSSAGVFITFNVLMADFLMPTLMQAVLPVWRIKKHILQGRAKTQAEYNQVGPRMELFTLYASLNGSLMVSLLYACIVPTVLPITFLKLLITYYSSKHKLLRLNPRPPMLDRRLAAASVLWLQLSLWFTLRPQSYSKLHIYICISRCV